LLTNGLLAIIGLCCAIVAKALIGRYGVALIIKLRAQIASIDGSNGLLVGAYVIERVAPLSGEVWIVEFYGATLR
jgi:hypothetical protein